MMCRSVLWLLLVTLAAAIPEEYQYCALRYRRLCQGKGRHVACQFPDSGPGQMCERYTPIKFTTDLKNFITHYINRRRQRIASGNERVRGGVHLPKPQIMMLVDWDRELSSLAQRLADQCTFVHDDCRATLKYPYAGQTVGEVRWRRSSDSDELSAQRAIRRVLDAWWGERRRVQSKQLTSPFRLTNKGSVWGHFSQLAVWNLQAVGCGAVRHGANHPRLLLVCDFSHTNMLGQKTLVPGNMAPCPQHTARRMRSPYPALCAPVRQPTPLQADLDAEDTGYDDGEEEEDTDDVDTVQIGEVPAPSLYTDKKENPDKLDNKPEKETTTQRTTAVSTIRYFADDIRPTEPAVHIEEPGYRRNPLPPPAHQIAVTMAPILPSVRTSEKERVVATDDELKRKSVFLNDRLFKPIPRERQTKKYYERQTKKTFERPYMDWSRRDEDHTADPGRGQEVIPLTRRPVLSGHDPQLLEVYRPTVTEEPTETLVPFRQRWKQSRHRQQRPGANALMHTSTPKQPKNTPEKPLNINLDKEDTDQFFRDTGFNLQWRKQKI